MMKEVELEKDVGQNLMQLLGGQAKRRRSSASSLASDESMLSTRCSLSGSRMARRDQIVLHSSARWRKPRRNGSPEGLETEPNMPRLCLFLSMRSPCNPGSCTSDVCNTLQKHGQQEGVQRGEHCEGRKERHPGL